MSQNSKPSTPPPTTVPYSTPAYVATLPASTNLRQHADGMPYTVDLTIKVTHKKQTFGSLKSGDWFILPNDLLPLFSHVSHCNFTTRLGIPEDTVVKSFICQKLDASTYSPVNIPGAVYSLDVQVNVHTLDVTTKAVLS